MHRFRALSLVFALCGLSVLACAPLPPGASPTSVLGGFAEERVQVGSFAVIDAVAASRRFVYAAGSGGVAVYDRLAERWMPPATRDLDRELGRDGAFAMGGPGGVQITTMAGDPVEDALWVGIPGAVIMYRPFSGQVQRVLVTGVPQRIVFDRGGVGGGDALVQSGGQWTRISRVGIATPMSAAPMASQVVVPPTLADLVARFPTLRAQPQMLLRNERVNRSRRPFALLAGAASPDRTSELWLGTDGEGLFVLDPTFAQGRALPYGLLEPGAGALAPAANGVWVGGLGLTNRRGGLTFATSDLQQWRWVEGTITVPLAGVRTFALATRGSRAWMATDRGLVRVQLDGDEDMLAYTRLSGLPDDRVFAVAPREGGSWAGTARGLVFVHDDTVRADADTRAARPLRGPGPTLLDGTAVYALQVAGDALWAGTSTGLVLLAADPASAAPPRLVVGTDPGLRTPVRALAVSDSVLLVATDDAVFRLSSRVAAGSPAATAATRVPELEPRFVGEPTRVALDDRTMALAGRDGVVLQSRVSGAARTLRVPVDVPGPVLDVLLQRDWIFLATPQGLVRHRRTTDGLVP
jgi:ligand-binding sensor domain-containing protein